ncbi:hypothetical protein cyc_00150 [Cyclospora cayetanensis]|uniref:Uncharacterized protein n=1 Tax=Cyclospora cayetanensis TaxID=88456 RepID=A0A1D3D0A5_9EIME|nr:hypothetical protein cyc_00150 [Cyclospora cayetanensis]
MTSPPLLRFCPPPTGDPLSLEKSTDVLQPLHALPGLRAECLAAVGVPENADDCSDTDYQVLLQQIEALLLKGECKEAMLELLTEERFSQLFTLIK